MTVFRGEPAKRENDRGARIWNGGVVDYDVRCHYPWKRRSTAKVNRGRRGGHVPESLASGGKEEVCRRIRRADGGGRHSAAPGTHGRRVRSPHGLPPRVVSLGWLPVSGEND
jgi:hypothetical protein